MPRYVIDISYHGTQYAGWQKQPNALTVQSRLDECLARILRSEVITYGAGRTDAGVHAEQLPAHFDYPGELHPRFLKAINAVLPNDIAVTAVYKAAGKEFNARFDARSRRYRYQITLRKDPHLFNRAWHCEWPLDIEKLNEAAAVLKEYRSFESFCKSNANNKTFFCDIMESRFELQGHMLYYHVKADRFLRGMVRAIMGTLVEAGSGRRSADDIRAVIEGKDRNLAGSSAPAWGLYLSEVEYPDGLLLPYEAVKQED